MDAAAERDVAVRLSVPVEVSGVRELGFVDIRGAEETHHLFALADGEALDLDVARRRPAPRP